MQSEWISIYSFTVVIISMMFQQSMNNHWTEKGRERDREIITLILQIPRKTNFSSTQDNTLASEISFSTGSITT